jgi:hypothetical protein
MHFLIASAAPVNVAALHFTAWERQGVAALFSADSEIAAGLFPLGPVWRNASPPRAIPCEEMGEFMPQCDVNLGRSELRNPRV